MYLFKEIVCNRLPDLAYYPVSPTLALPLYVSDTFKMSYGLRSSGSTFMYLYYLISIDLQLGCLFNSHTLQSLQLWARPAYRTASNLYVQRLLSNQLLPRLRSHYFFYLCKCFELLLGTSLVLVITFIYQTDDWISNILNIDRTEPDRTNPTVRTLTSFNPDIQLINKIDLPTIA